MVLAVVRRTLKGQSPFAADRQHLHHRLMNLGHSDRSVALLMYLWTAVFTGLVVGLSVVRIPLIGFALITLAAFGALVLATVPKLRPWPSTGGGRRELPRGSRLRSDEPLSASPDLAAPVGRPAPGPLPPAAASSANGTGLNSTGLRGPGNGTGPGNGAHAKRPLPGHRLTPPPPPSGQDRRSVI